MNRHRNNTGFTLIELLVALAMVATIVSMVYGSYAATSRSLEVYDSRLSCSERAQLALRLMTRQIRCAYAPVEPNDVETVPAQTGTASVQIERKVSAAASQTSIRKPAPVFDGDPQSGRGEILRFMTTAGLGGGPTAPQRLSYTRYRYDRITETLSIDQGTGASQFGGSDSAPHWQLLLDRVKGVDLGFHDGRQWQQKWDYTQEKTLPRAVRIDLTVVDENGREYHLESTASIGYRAAAPQQASRQTTVGKKP